MLKCTTLADGTQALDVEPSIRCDVQSYMVWRNLAILSVCLYVIGIPSWLAYVMFRLRPPLNADAVCGGWLFIPRTRRRAEELRRQKRLARGVGGEEEYRLMQSLDAWSRKYSTLTRPFSDQYYYWSIVIILRNLIVAVVSIVCTTIPLYQACLTLLTLAMAVLLQQSRKPYRAHTGMNELEQSSLSCAILILFLGILFFAELGTTTNPSDVLSWMVLSLVFCFSTITAGLFVKQLVRSYERRKQPVSVDEDKGQLDATLLRRMQRIVKVKSHQPFLSLPAVPGKEQRMALHPLGKAHSDGGVELASLDRSARGEPEDVSCDSTSEEGGLFSHAPPAGEHKQAASESDVELMKMLRRAEPGLLSIPSTASTQPSSPPSGDDGDHSRVAGEEAAVEGSRKPVVHRVQLQMITSPFPAPLTIFSPLVKSSSNHKLSLTRPDSSEKRGAGGEPCDDDPQTFLIDHSHILPLAPTQPPAVRYEPAPRNRSAAAKWATAITAVRAQLRERGLTQSRPEVFIIRGAREGGAALAPLAERSVDAEVPAVFRLRTRPGGASEQRPTTSSSSSSSSSSSASSSDALRIAAPWPRSPPPPRRAQLQRRPSLSLSSFAPIDSLQSEVSVFSTLYGSTPASPHSPRSQSHFVIPPAALRHEVQATYHHRQQRSADLAATQLTRINVQLPLPAQGVTLLLSDDLQQAMSTSRSSDSGSHSRLSE